MTSLTPTAYLFLLNPNISDGVTLIRTTLQEMCLKGILRIEGRMVQIDSRGEMRERFVLTVNNGHFKVEELSTSEKFLLQLFDDQVEWNFTELRSFILSKFGGGDDIFKDRYVFKELMNKKLLLFSFLLSRKGRREKNELKDQLEYINSSVDLLIQKNTIGFELNRIGINALLLEPSVLNKIIPLQLTTPENTIGLAPSPNFYRNVALLVSKMTLGMIDSTRYRKNAPSFSGVGGRF